jgi:hypothetical protein
MRTGSLHIVPVLVTVIFLAGSPPAVAQVETPGGPLVRELLHQLMKNPDSLRAADEFSRGSCMDYTRDLDTDEISIWLRYVDYPMMGNIDDQDKLIIHYFWKSGPRLGEEGFFYCLFGNPDLFEKAKIPGVGSFYPAKWSDWDRHLLEDGFDEILQIVMSMLDGA